MTRMRRILYRRGFIIIFNRLHITCGGLLPRLLTRGRILCTGPKMKIYVQGSRMLDKTLTSDLFVKFWVHTAQLLLSCAEDEEGEDLPT